MIPKFISRIKLLFAPHSLRYQLLIRSLYILASLLLLIGVLQYFLMQDFVYKNKAEAMKAQLATLPRDFYEKPNAISSEPIQRGSEDPAQNLNRFRRPLLFLPESSLAIIDLEGNFTDISAEDGNRSPQLSKKEYVQILDEWTNHKKVNYQVVKNSAGSEQLTVFRPLGSRDHLTGMLQLSTGMRPLKELLGRQLLTFFILSFFALLGGFAVSLPVLRRTLIPLSRMVSTVQRTDAGNLSEQLPVDQGQEEIDRLSVSFNGMLERLDASFKAEREAKEQMRRFIADASHELRTPLTSIHGFLEVLLRGAAEKPEQLYSALNSMHGESKRINKLVNDLLLLAKLDRTPQLIFSDTQLDEILREMEPQLQMLAGNRKVHVNISERIRGKYDSDKIKQVLLNLFHNAVQHTDPDQGKIVLKLGITGNEAELSIRDNGSGIDEQHLPHIFERFYRGESSRSRRSGGAGLGLSITKSIVEAHGGTITVESKVREGSIFQIRLPVSP